MKIKDQTPEEVLTANPFAEKFISVLDGVGDYKTAEINKAHRYYRSPINTNLLSLRKRLENDYGFPSIPADFPKEILDALLLNANDINALRGSKQGLQLWLWCLTFGEIVIDDSAFYPIPEFIILSDLSNGFLNKFDPLFPATLASPDLFLFSGDLAEFGTYNLTVDIATKFSGEAFFPSLEEYINTHIKKYLTFVSQDSNITINFSDGEYVTNTFPYQYFVITNAIEGIGGMVVGSTFVVT